MSDLVFDRFRARQLEEVERFSAQCSRLSCEQVATGTTAAPDAVAVTLDCKYLVKDEVGVRLGRGPCHFGLRMPSDYLRRTFDHPGQIVSLIAPTTVWHPNIRWPFFCLGHINPGTPLVELIVRVVDVLTFQRFTSVEKDALNGDACVWVRAHMDEVPLEIRPLRDDGVVRESTAGGLLDLDLEALSPGART